MAGLLANLSGDIELTTGPVSGGSATTAPARIALTAKSRPATACTRRSASFCGRAQTWPAAQYYATTPPCWSSISVAAPVPAALGGSSATPIDDDDAGNKDRLRRGHNGQDSQDSQDRDRPDRRCGDGAIAPDLRPTREAKPGDKLFSTRPLPVDWMHKYEMRLKGSWTPHQSRGALPATWRFPPSWHRGDCRRRPPVRSMRAAPRAG